jgi:hypothetical protein
MTLIVIISHKINKYNRIMIEADIKSDFLGCELDMYDSTVDLDTVELRKNG